MRRSIKHGFGFFIGMSIAQLFVSVTSATILELAANNEKFMKRMKVIDPKVHERLKKYSN